jgi:flagellar biosynthesis GTPase FlhF
MGISYITMGQNVPEDIEVATPQRVVQMLFGAQ